MIHGVKRVPLKKIPDERGCAFTFLKPENLSWPAKEVYLTMAYPGVIKGWHLHKETSLAIACVAGNAKYALYDDRKDSPTKGEVNEFYIGENQYEMIVIPPGIWNGIKCVGDERCLVAVGMSQPYDPDEILRLDPLKNDIPYDWSLKNG